MLSHDTTKEAPPKSSERAFQCALILPVLLSRLYSFLSHVLLDSLNGRLFPVEYPGGQGGFSLGLSKDL